MVYMCQINQIIYLLFMRKKMRQIKTNERIKKKHRVMQYYRIKKNYARKKNMRQFN